MEKKVYCHNFLIDGIEIIIRSDNPHKDATMYLQAKAFSEAVKKQIINTVHDTKPSTSIN